MNPETIFREWTGDSIWSPWVKPVLFAHLSPSMIAGASVPSEEDDDKVDVSRVPRATGTTAVVVDLPGGASVSTGLVLAGVGYRPVPLYNAVPVLLPSATPPQDPTSASSSMQPEPNLQVSLGGFASEPPKGPKVAIDMSSITRLLVRGAENASLNALSQQAPPAFLLDSRRRGIDVTCGPGDFDNRSISLPTDFPSANVLLAARIRDVIVIQELGGAPQQDLAHTLRRWQEAGINILTSAPGGAPQLVVVSKPPRFRHMWYEFLARLGLRKNPIGGFGGFLPLPSAG